MWNIFPKIVRYMFIKNITATAPKIHYGKCLLLWHMFLGRDGRKSTMYATDFNEELFSVNWINRSMGKEDAIDE
ncbi:hypothetical protein F230042K4_10430 [Mediterraneibacter glycyrrhizinilyticus]|jgi:hypothetical protein